LVLPICFNLTNWKLPEMSFISVNKRCFIEENVDLSIVYARGRKPSLRQVLECLPIKFRVSSRNQSINSCYGCLCA
ncbi:hypothetical protein T11_16733, partial [Trichinella zimbabwensis]